MMVCEKCGYEMAEGEGFCRHCGNIGASVEVSVRRSGSSSMTALMLALIPGLFNLFGLGHLFLRRYIRAAVLLCISAVLFVIPYIYDIDSDIAAFTIIVFAIFFLQALDIVRMNSSGVSAEKIER